MVLFLAMQIKHDDLIGNPAAGFADLQLCMSEKLFEDASQHEVLMATSNSDDTSEIETRGRHVVCAAI